MAQQRWHDRRFQRPIETTSQRKYIGEKTMPLNTGKLNGNSNGSGKGFTPTPKADRQPSAQSKTNQFEQSTQVCIDQVKSVGLATVQKGVGATQALAIQREALKTQLKAEILHLTDPSVFFAELMSEVATEISQTPGQLDFFGCYSIEGLALPERKPIALLSQQVQAS
jgi:hypothetical protein